MKKKIMFAAIPSIEHGVWKSHINGTHRIVRFLFSFALLAKNLNGSPKIPPKIIRFSSTVEHSTEQRKVAVQFCVDDYVTNIEHIAKHKMGRHQILVKRFGIHTNTHAQGLAQPSIFTQRHTHTDARAKIEWMNGIAGTYTQHCD